jgi:diadenylate cyclase
MIFLTKIGFFTITIWDALDILIVGLLLFQVYKLLKGSLGFSIVVGLILVYVSWQMVSILEMPMLSSILGKFVSMGVIALLILFQPEVRRFLLFVGQGSLETRFKFLARFFKSNQNSDTQSVEREKSVRDIIRAVEHMAANKIGALMIFTHSIGIEDLYSSGVMVDGNVSSQLILSIFNKDSPLHDGAIIIKNSKIIAASCVLPVSNSPNIPQRLGLRHRAAVGISENTNVLVFVVSEETGRVSYAERGEVTENIDGAIMRKLLEKVLFLQ